MINYENMTKEQVIGLLKDTLEYTKEQDKEIDRLTEANIALEVSTNYWCYIVEELEKWLKEEYQYADKHIFPGSIAGVAMGQINRTKNKLQELKRK